MREQASTFRLTRIRILYMYILQWLCHTIYWLFVGRFDDRFFAFRNRTAADARAGEENG